MANFASSFRDEVSRLARREVRQQVDPLRKSNAQLRQTVSTLKSELAALQRSVAFLQSREKRRLETPPPVDESRQLRFSPAWVKADRQRLGISAKDYGHLVGVSALTIYSWENGKSKLLWEFDCNPKTSKYTLGGRADRNHIIGTPVIHDGLVYVAVGEDPEHGEGVGHLWCIDPTKRGDVSSELAVSLKDPTTPLPRRRIQAVIEMRGHMAQVRYYRDISSLGIGYPVQDDERSEGFAFGNE